MMPKRTLLFIMLLVTALLHSATLSASGSDLSGFSIDLWQEIAQHLQLDFRYIEVETVIYERIYRFWFGSAPARFSASSEAAQLT